MSQGGDYLKRAINTETIRKLGGSHVRGVKEE